MGKTCVWYTFSTLPEVYLPPQFISTCDFCSSLSNEPLSIFDATGYAAASAQLKKLDGVAEPNCRVVDAKAEYNTDVDTKDLTTKEDYDTVTSEIGTALSGLSYKTSRRRRLLGDVSTTSTYAAQDVTECAEDDTECQNDNAIEEDPAGSKKKIGEETSDGLSNSSRAVSLVSGWLLILLIGFIL